MRQIKRFFYNFLIFSLNILVCFWIVGNFGSERVKAAWYDSGWNYRKKITIDADDVPNTDQSNFPVLISLTDTDWKETGSGGHVGQSDGGDFLFTDSSDNKLDHEIEEYNPSTGELIAWVEVPTVSASTDTDIYIYYGNASCSDQWDIEGTWNEGGSGNYKMVQHLQEPSGTHLDSTSNNNDSTTVSVTTQGSATGKVDGADDFDGRGSIDFDITNDYYQITDDASLTLQDGDWSVGFWSKMSYRPGSFPFVVNSNNYAVINSLTVFLHPDDKWYFRVRDGDGTDWHSTAGPLGVDNIWRLIVIQRRTADNQLQLWSCQYGQTSSKGTSVADTGFNAIDGGDWYINRLPNDGYTRYGNKLTELYKGDFSLSQSEVTNMCAGNTIIDIGKSPDIYLPMHSADAILDDQAGNNDATRYGSPTTEEDFPFGQHIDMDDGASNSLDFGDTDDFTLEAWFYRDSNLSDDTVVAKRNGQAAGDIGYTLWIDDATDDINFEVSDGTDEFLINGTTSIGTGWYHIGVVFDQDSASNSKVYLNSADDTESTTGTIGNVGDLSNAVDFRIGTESDSAEAFDGIIDEVRVSNTVRLADWIATSYNNQNNPTVGGFLASMGPEESTYIIPADVIGAGGGESRSTNYVLQHNIGEPFTYRSAGATYGVQEGFLQSVNTTLTLSIVNGPIGFGSLNPGGTNTDAIDVRITTDAWNGYTLGTYMVQHSNASCTDRYALCQSTGTAYVPNISATIASPAVWSDDGLGFTITGGTGVAAKWDSGSNYASIPSSETVFHTKTGYKAPSSSPAYDETNLGFKVAVPSAQKAGDYDNTSYFTVTAAL